MCVLSQRNLNELLLRLGSEGAKPLHVGIELNVHATARAFRFGYKIARGLCGSLRARLPMMELFRRQAGLRVLFLWGEKRNLAQCA